MTADIPTRQDRNPVGWGFTDHGPTTAEATTVRGLLSSRFGPDALWSSPVPAHALQSPRVAIPTGLRSIMTNDPDVRLLHAAGRSFTDMVALRETGVSVGPDIVARPQNPDDVEAVLAFCDQADMACIPVGGGSSVVGAVTAARVDGPVLALQMRAMDRVLQVDPNSRAALIQAGAAGPVIEGQLRDHDLTTRFFPQSFEMATLGGWIATRAGGHYATRLTHIDDLVESVDAIAPAGRWSSRRLPASGAGPSPDRMLLGSEGSLAVITQAWLRLQDRPRFKGGLTVTFDSLVDALTALRPLVQSGLDPANCRVLDPLEAVLNGAGDGRAAVMVVGAESPVVDVSHDLQALAELLADHGGTPSPITITLQGGQATDAADQSGAAGEWKQSFLRAPYLRDTMIDAGMVVETFETAVTYDRLHDLVNDVLAATTAAIEEVCGDGLVTCRVTHAYPDGAAPYFTVMAPGRPGARAAQWQQVKVAASEALASAGGTITHHHAVGRDHRPWYDQQRPDLFAQALAAAKQALDPAGILNPGVLIG